VWGLKLQALHIQCNVLEVVLRNFFLKKELKTLDILGKDPFHLLK